MSKFIDVTADKWFYNDIEELMSIYVDGSTFYSGIPYNKFEEGKECVDYEIVNTKNGEHEFYIPKKITPTSTNPLIVYVDGVIVAVDEIKNQPDGTTYAKLTRGVANGSIVRFFYAGEPSYVVLCCADEAKVHSAMDVNSSVVGIMKKGDTAKYVDRPENGNWYKVKDFPYAGVEGFVQIGLTRHTAGDADLNGVTFPSAPLIIDAGYWYEYDPFNGITPEIVKWMGRPLQRVSSLSEITYDGLEYCIINNRLFANYSLNNEVLDITVLEKNSMGIQKPKYQRLRLKSDKIVYVNRFFPEVLASKGELLTSLNHLLKNVFARYTDVKFESKVLPYSRFTDVQELLSKNPSNPPWWWEKVCPLEQLKLPDGRWLIEGDERGRLNIDMPITRAELAALMDKFRIWAIEAFK